MQISLRMLHYVVTTAEAGSISGGAKLLNISQPSISQAIAQVEARLGVPLFVRHHARGMTTTAAGRHFVNEARLLLSHARDFTRSAESLGADLSGDIAIGSFVTLAARFMPGLLAEFGRRVPRVSVSLEEGNQQEIMDGLTSGRLELALAYAYAVPDEILGERLAELPPHILVSADHRLADRSEISLKELAGEPFILLDLPFSRDYFFNLFLACGAEPRIAYRSRSPELIRGLVAHGQGYTIHNALPGRDLSYDGRRISALAISERPAPVHVVALRLRRQNMRPAVRLFADFMAEAFAPGGLFGLPSGMPARPA
ncbi:MAG: LysR family transcriptional regulator [Phreatobacter sp.]